MSKNRFSTRARLSSFGYAFKGLAYFFRTQHNSWIQLAAALVAIVFGFWLEITHNEWLWIIFCIGFVFAAEMFNTAVETLSDVVSPEQNEKIGKVKDVAAAGVLMASITALVIGGIIFGPRICWMIWGTDRM
jgi:diacylglycerol kinase (ATP)